MANTDKHPVQLATAYAVRAASQNTTYRVALSRLDGLNPAGDWNAARMFYSYFGHFAPSYRTGYSSQELGGAIALSLWAGGHTLASTALSTRILKENVDEESLRGTGLGSSLRAFANILSRGKDSDLPPGFLRKMSVLVESSTSEHLYANLRSMVKYLDSASDAKGRGVGVDYSRLARDLAYAIQPDGSIDRKLLTRWTREFWTVNVPNSLTTTTREKS